MAQRNVSQPPEGDNRTTETAGREFCRFGLEHNISCVPVDDIEDSRFDEYHDILAYTFSDNGAAKLVFPPFPPNGVESPGVLDCGSGTGSWAFDLLDAYQECIVTAVDIFSRDIGRDTTIVKKTWNLNAPFRHDGSESGLKPETFHLINSRFLADGIDAGRWTSLVGEYKSLLMPGGWLQMVEVDWTFRSAHDCSGGNLPHLQAWVNEYNRAQGLYMTKDPSVALNLQVLLRTAEFDRVKRQIYQVPVGGWMDANGITLGNRMVGVVFGMLESFALIPFQRLAISQARRDRMIRDARTELVPGLQVYFEVHVVYGRRPPVS